MSWRSSKRSPLGLVVLGMLAEEPMHVYRMQRLIESRGKDRVVNVRSRASLYQTVLRLARLGLVEVRERLSQAGYPDRTVYALTGTGQETATRWLREMLSTPTPEFPEFAAAVSLLAALEPEDAERQLARRAELLEVEHAEATSVLEGQGGLPRLFLLEDEYRVGQLATELLWLRGVLADLREGRLHWDAAWLEGVRAEFEDHDER